MPGPTVAVLGGGDTPLDAGTRTQKTLTIFLTASPYAGEGAFTAMRLARAVLEAGHRVNLFASVDGVYALTVGHRAKGVPDIEAGFRMLIEQGLHVELCGSCLALRGVGADQRAPGAEPSSLRGLFRLIQESDALITVGG